MKGSALLSVAAAFAVVVAVVLAALVASSVKKNANMRFKEYVTFAGSRCFTGDYATECKEALQLSDTWSKYPMSMSDLMALVGRFEVGIAQGVEDLYTKQVSKTSTVVSGGSKSFIPMCVAYRDGSHLIVACRGTADMYDWSQNTRYKQTAPFPDISTSVAAHTGFLTEFKRVEKAFAAMLSDTANPVTKLSLVGHSMGCGVASLCALYTVYNRPDIAVSGLLVASPRLGNPEMVEALKPAGLVTLVNVADPFPALPPSLSPKGLFVSGNYSYCHMGTVLAFNEFAPTAMNMHGIYPYWMFVATEESKHDHPNIYTFIQ